MIVKKNSLHPEAFLAQLLHFLYTLAARIFRSNISILSTLKTIIFLAAFFLLFSCAKKDTQDVLTARMMTDISYGTDTRQKFDLYLPAQRNSTDTKILVLIHGGGWTEGDKVDFNPFIIEMQKRLPDYAIANINYRLVSNNQNLFPAQENDVNAAIEFIAGKSAEYNISRKISLLGASAGGHLSLLQAYKHTASIPVKAVISLFGPTELVSLYNNSSNSSISLLLKTVTGGTPATNLSIYQQSSPYNFVTSSSCPTLLLHGGNDPLVPASQSVMLNNELQAMGVVHEYVFYPSEGHGWTGPNLADTFNRIEAFLKQQVK